MQSFSMQGHKRVHHVNFLQPHQRGWKHFSLPEHSENSGKCSSITLSTHVETVCLLSKLQNRQHIEIERENYNKSKYEHPRQAKCPPEKEVAIMEALQHFGMI